MGLAAQRHQLARQLSRSCGLSNQIPLHSSIWSAAMTIPSGCWRYMRNAFISARVSAARRHWPLRPSSTLVAFLVNHRCDGFAIDTCIFQHAVTGLAGGQNKQMVHSLYILLDILLATAPIHGCKIMAAASSIDLRVTLMIFQPRSVK